MSIAARGSKDEWKERLVALLEGRVTPLNDFAKYFIERLREGKAEYEVTLRNIATLEQQLEGLQRQRLAIEGRNKAYTEDLRHWDNTPGKAIFEQATPSADKT